MCYEVKELTAEEKDRQEIQSLRQKQQTLYTARVLQTIAIPARIKSFAVYNRTLILNSSARSDGYTAAMDVLDALEWDVREKVGALEVDGYLVNVWWNDFIPFGYGYMSGDDSPIKVGEKQYTLGISELMSRYDGLEQWDEALEY